MRSGLVFIGIFGLSLSVQGCEQKRSEAEGEAVAARPVALAEAPHGQVASPSLDGAVLDADAQRALPEAARRLADASRLPILVPRRMAGAGRLLVEENWYDFAFHDRAGGTEVHVKGVGVLHDDVPLPKPNEAMGGREVFVNRSELITSVSFRANGIAYTVTLECGGRVCDDSNELRGIVNDLALVSVGSMGGAR
jgi:hypothetical protein